MGVFLFMDVVKLIQNYHNVRILTCESYFRLSLLFLEAPWRHLFWIPRMILEHVVQDDRRHILDCSCCLTSQGESKQRRYKVFHDCHEEGRRREVEHASKLEGSSSCNMYSRNSSDLVDAGICGAMSWRLVSLPPFQELCLHSPWICRH